MLSMTHYVQCVAIRGGETNMIILDSDVARCMSFDTAEARLVRVIRESKTDRVALPWMAFEKRLAQYVLDYQEAHRAADVSAHRTLGRMLPRLADSAVPVLTDPAWARRVWDERLRELVDVIPTPLRRARRR